MKEDVEKILRKLKEVSRFNIGMSCAVDDFIKHTGQVLLKADKLPQLHILPLLNVYIDLEELIKTWARVALLRTSSSTAITSTKDQIINLIDYMLEPTIKKEKGLVEILVEMTKVFSLNKKQLELYLIVINYAKERALNANEYKTQWGKLFGCSRDQKLTSAKKLLQLLLGTGTQLLNNNDVSILHQGDCGKAVSAWEEKHSEKICDVISSPSNFVLK